MSTKQRKIWKSWQLLTPRNELQGKKNIFQTVLIIIALLKMNRIYLHYLR